MIKNLIDTYGGRELLMSRIYIIGQGRVGKTCLYRGMVGKDFQGEEKSTVGAEEGMFEVSDAHVEAQEQWSKFDPSKHPGYHAEALAKLEVDRRQGRLASSAESITTFLTAKGAHGVGLDSKDSDVSQDRVATLITNTQLTKKETEEKIYSAAEAGNPKDTTQNDAKRNEDIVMPQVEEEKKKEEKEEEELSIKSLDESLVIKYMKEKTPGLKWEDVGPKKPETGLEIHNEALAAALQTKTHFSIEDLNDLKAFDLSYDVYIKAGRKYFKPVMSEALKLSVWDFGGQDRFYLLHLLFLSSLGVYLICFNMVDILGEKTKRREALKFLRFWLQTVSSHDLGEDGKPAPVLLVGTHKDEVPSDECHRKISEVLKQEFLHCDVWKKTLEWNHHLCFFPVNNMMGQEDSVVRAIMGSVCKLVKGQEHMRRKVPLTWLALFDEFVCEEDATIMLEDVERRAKRCGFGTYKQRSRSESQLSLQEEVQIFLSTLQD